jgi:thiamine biosynthesis lipoprotein
MTTRDRSLLFQTAFLALFSLLAVAQAQASEMPDGSLATLHGTTMGTTYVVRIAHMPPGFGTAQLQTGIERVLDSIDRQMSTYRPDSEISRFNAKRSTAWIDVSRDTELVIAEALRISRLADGAFDVTVAPLVDLWGFGAIHPSQRIPAAEAIDAARVRVGYSHVEVRRRPPAVRKQRADIHIDLSAIAKGFGVDKVAQHLEDIGMEDYLVDIGGEIRARGRNRRGQPWTVAVELPSAEPIRASSVVRLDDAAIATSGDYRNYYDRDGTRYSHIIDPRSGAPIRHALASVAVVTRSAMQADALATALLVLGPEEGLRLAAKEGIAAHFIVRHGDGFRELRTNAFERMEAK